MRVLYVEDNVEFGGIFRDLVRTRMPSVELTLIEDLMSADRLIREEVFSLIMLDLAIPRGPGGEPLIEIGEELFRRVEATAPGTPVLIFTGQDSERITDELRDGCNRRVRYMGGVERPIVTVRRKDRIEKAIELIEGILESEQAIEAITLSDFNKGALQAEIGPEDRKLLKAFCRFRTGRMGRVARLSGGLSGSAVYRVDVLAADASVLQRSVVKIDKGDAVEREAYRYEAYVTRLASGYPPMIPGDIVAGGARRALCFNLAGDFNSNFFRFRNDAGRLIADLRRRLDTWYQAAERHPISIRQVILDIAGDRGLTIALGQEESAGLKEILGVEFEQRKSIQHGDLHGENILCDAAGSNICLIDFADVREVANLLDVVTLELSPLFHPTTSNDPIIELLRRSSVNWFDESSLIRDFPAAEWIVHTRAWIRDVALSHVDFAATVLGYAIRQLKYDDTDKVFANRLICLAMAQIQNR